MRSIPIIDRYLFKELAIPFAQAVAFLLVVMIFGQLLKLADQFSALGLSASAIARAILYSVAPSLGVIFPIALLLAALLGFAKLASDGEIIALSASGISFPRLLVAPLLIGFSVTVVSSALSIWGEPWGIRSLQRLLSDAVKESLSQGIQPKTFYSWLPGIMLYTEKRGAEANTFQELLFVDLRNPAQGLTLQARQARIVPVADQSALLFVMQDGEVLSLSGENLTRVAFAENEFILNLGQISRRGEGLFVNRQGMTLAELNTQSENPAVSASDRAAYRTALHKKFAIPLSSMIFALLGCLLSSRRSRASVAVGLFVGASVVGVYYYVMRTGELSAMHGSLPAWLAMWAPNLVFFAITLGMTIHRRQALTM